MCSLSKFKISNSLAVSDEKAKYSAVQAAHWSYLSDKADFSFSKLTLLVSRDFLHSAKYFSVDEIKAVSLALFSARAFF